MMFFDVNDYLRWCQSALHVVTAIMEISTGRNGASSRVAFRVAADVHQM